MAKLFISYSHKDEDIKEQIEAHFSTLIKHNIVQIWQDRLLEAGSDFGKKIKVEIEDADIILLLISSNFFNSEYCYEKEMSIALTRYKNGDSVVIPIIVSKYKWEKTKVGKLMALPKDGKPIKKHHHRDDAYSYITEKVEEVATKLNTRNRRINTFLNRVNNKKNTTKRIYDLVSKKSKCYAKRVMIFIVIGAIGLIAVKLYTTDLPDVRPSKPIWSFHTDTYSTPYIIKVPQANFRSSKSKRNRGNIIRTINRNEIVYTYNQEGQR